MPRLARVLRPPVVVLAALVLAACTAVSGVEPATAALLEEHDLRAAGPTSTAAIEIGPVHDAPWLLYREASQEIGLDFAGLSGATAQLRTTPLENDGLRVHVLVANDVAVGAWLSAEDLAPGIFALTDPPE